MMNPYTSLIDYFMTHGWERYARRGRAAGGLVAWCRARGFRIGTAKSPVYGRVNTYPVTALDEYFPAPSKAG